MDTNYADVYPSGLEIGLPLRENQVWQAAGVMARAFLDDPFFTFTIPDDTRRRRILPWIFGKTITYGRRYGRVYTNRDLEGVALWLGPQNPNLAWRGALQTGLFLLPLKLSWLELRRNLRLAKSSGRLHAESISGRHWYLVGLGVEPACQNRGVGGALLQPILQQADRQAVACYLDTNNEQNIQYYERLGFKLAGRLQAGPDDPPTWGMLRKAG